MSTAPASDAGAPVLDSDNPWPGLASYDEAAREFFSGRGAEAAELARRIADESVTVLFGKSGLGKSSLLRAGVFPLLRERGFLPVLVRLRYDADTAEPLEQIAAALFAAFAVGQIKHPPRRDGESLWEYLHREGLAFWAPKIRPARPVLVLDQFEEVFTLGRRAWTRVEAFREQFADLAENRIPAALAQRFEASGVASAGLDVHAQPYKIVLSLREDFLPDLEGWHAAMPSLRRNRMRLLPMGTPQALQAVWNERTRHLVDEPLAHEIVGFLAADAGASDSHAELDGDAHEATVEPALLSLVCRGINEARKRAGKEQFDAKLFDAGKGQIVADFYRECLADRRPAVRLFIEDELVTDQGFRNSFAVVAAVGSGAVTDDELAILVDRRLLRLEHHLGTERVELAHDLLTRAVLEGRVQRVAAELAADRRRRAWKVVGAAAALIAIVGAFAWQDHLREKEAGMVVSSRNLAAHATTVMPRNGDLAVLLALNALHAADTLEARSAMLEAARYVWPTADLSKNGAGRDPTHIAIDAEGGRVGVVGSDDMVSVWDVSERSPVWRWSESLEGQGVTVVEFEPGGENLLVARRGNIDLRKASTGEPRATIELPELTDDSVAQIAVSTEGRWLAAGTSFGAIFVRKLDDSAADWERALESESEAFSLSPDGQRIAWVAANPLRIKIVERESGKWVAQADPVAVQSCAEPHSVSTASEYVVATWHAQSCTWPLLKGAAASPQSTQQPLDIDDNVASASGAAFVSILSNGDLRIGRGSLSQAEGVSLIKGADIGEDNNWLGKLAVDDAGMRLAMIRGDTARIVSAGPHKLLLYEFEPGRFALLADGRRIAHAVPTPTGLELQVTAIEQVLSGNELPQPELRFPLPAMPTALQSAQNRLMVSFGGSRQTTVYDLASGRPVVGPIAGAGEFLGKDGELILLRLPQATAAVVRRADDGAELASWDTTGGRAEGRRVSVSRKRTALFVTQPSDVDKETLVVDTFAVEGNQLVSTGRLVDVPATSIKRPQKLEISDDARSLTEKRDAIKSPLLWPLDPDGDTSARDPATAQTQEQTQEPGSIELGRSSTGIFSVRGTPVDSSDADGEPLYDIALYDGDGTTILHGFGTRELDEFPSSFSHDDRWFAFTEGADLRVIDLRTRQPVLRWQGIDAEALEFDATGTLLRVEVRAGKKLRVMVVPFAPDVLQRFAKWLVPRDLTEDERCKYGLGQCPVQSSR